MSALSTPGGGGTTAQSKPTSGKQKYQKLDINSLYCANRNENSEPSSVKSQLSRKHGMQSLGKVPSARRPPANLPSLKTESGQDTNTNSISATTTTSTPPACTTQTTTLVTSTAAAAVGAGGWVALPPPSSPHFRTEFPSLEAAAQPSHRVTDHSPQQMQLRPQTEGSWTCGGTVGIRQEVAPASSSAAPSTSQQTPTLHAILPPFLMKGSGGTAVGLATMGMRESRPGRSQPRVAAHPPPPPRAIEVPTARPIPREEQISSLDDISRDAGWAQHDDIDYDQKLDFSDGETAAPTVAGRGNKSNNNRSNVEGDKMDTKGQDPGDEEQLWAERRQKQNNEVAQIVARARQRKEEEQRRQMRDAQSSLAPSGKENRDRNDRDRNDRDRNERERIDRDRNEREKNDRDRNDNRDRDHVEIRDKDRGETRERERNDNRDKDRTDIRERDIKEKERLDNRDSGRFDNRDRERPDNRDRDRDRLDNRDNRIDNRDSRSRGDRDRADIDKDRDNRDRDRNDNRDRDRFERDRDRSERNSDRDFRDRDRDFARDRDQSNPAYSKTYGPIFQSNIPPRFLKQQQNRQTQDDQHNKGWAFSGKAAPRRPEAPQYNPPRHNGRRSYSRDYSDREDEFRRDKEGGGQWRSEMQDYDRSSRELDRQNSKESYKDYGDFKDRRNDTDRKLESSIDINNRTSAADKLTEVFERKSIGISETFMSEISHNLPSERKHTPPLNVVSHRESLERDFSQTSWADASQDDKELHSHTLLKGTYENTIRNDIESHNINDRITKEISRSDNDESERIQNQLTVPVSQISNQSLATATNIPSQLVPGSTQIHKFHSNQGFPHTQHHIMQASIVTVQPLLLASNAAHSLNYCDNPSQSKAIQPVTKYNANDQHLSSHLQTQNQLSSEPLLQQNILKPVFLSQKSEKEISDTDSMVSQLNIDPSCLVTSKLNEVHSVESLSSNAETQKKPTIVTDDNKHSERFNNEHKNQSKEPLERKSSGSGSEKKGRGYGGFAVYGRGWGSRESRGRRSHRSSRSNNRASESDGSTDGTPNLEKKERRRAPRSPRGPKKPERTDDQVRIASTEQVLPQPDGLENREPFAPRGQPSRRGRGGFQGSTRPPAPAKRVTGYGPPNTKSPFSQANRAVKDNEEIKDNLQIDDKNKINNKPKTGSSTGRPDGGRGRDRRPKGPPSGEDENWETTSEHSEGGGPGIRRRSACGRPPGSSQPKVQGPRNQNNNGRNVRNVQGGKKDNGDNIITEGMADLKLINKKDDEVIDDGFQEVRNKRNSKDTRGPPSKEDMQNSSKQQRSHSNQGGVRNVSSTRNTNEKPQGPRGSAPISSKPGIQYERNRQPNLAPRFVKQRQKQQMGMSGFGNEPGAVPPPPAINAWDKPLRANVEEIGDSIENKSGNSSQRSTPGDLQPDAKISITCSLSPEKTGVLDGTTPPIETIIFENTNYKTTPPAEALKQKYQQGVASTKSQGDDVASEVEPCALTFNGDVRPPLRSIQELIAENGRPSNEGENLGLQMTFEANQKGEDSSDMKLDFAFDSDLGQLTEDKAAKTLGLQRTTHTIVGANAISPLAADLNFKIASVKKVWEMPAVVEGTEELQFSGFEENQTEAGAPPNVCKVKPTQQLQSPPPQHYNHVSYQGGYGGLSVPSPPAVMFNSSQQLLGSSQQLPQQGSLYGAFLEQSRGQFGGFPGAPYGAGSGAPYNYQPTPDMFQSLPNQYRMAAAAAAGGGAAFGQSGQLGNNPSTVLISSTSNSLMSASVKPSTQQIGAIGSKGGGVGNVGGVGGVGGVNTYQQQYLGYSGPVGEAPYTLPGLMPRPAPPANSYYTTYQPPTAPAPTYPMQFTQPAQSGAFGSQFLSSQLQVAAAVQQMQQQYRAPMQQQYGPPAPRPQPPQLKSPLHEQANGFARLCDAASPTPKPQQPLNKPQKPPHSPPHHKYHTHHPPQQMGGVGNNVRVGGMGGGSMARGGLPGSVAPRYPSPIQRPHAPALSSAAALFRPALHQQRQHQRQPAYYHQHQHQRNTGSGGGAGGGVSERVCEPVEPAAGEPPEERSEPSADSKPE